MIPAVIPSYARVDVAFERGEGPYLFASDGRRFLDFGAGIAVSAVGHAHPQLVEALVGQARKLWHTSNLYRILEQERLAQRLVDATFADTVFFCNSGGEAVETSVKMARKHHHDAGRTERTRVIAFEGAFHGRSLAMISAGANAVHKHGFGPMVDGFDHVAFDDLSQARGAITAETAAILVEPVQGEGGIRPASPEFLRGLRETCDEFGLLLIYDEVQCGMGRTGKLFAHEWSGAAPDIMAVAKALGGGFPVGACLATEDAASGIVAGTHGSTFGGNPLAMAVSNAVLDIILEDGFLEHVRQTGESLASRLASLTERYPGVVESVRGVGMMWGIKCVGANAELANRLIDNRLLVILAADNVVRLLPPLIVDESHLDEAFEIIEAACAELAR